MANYHQGHVVSQDEDDLSDEFLLKARDIAKLLGISRSLAYRLMSDGTLPSVRIGRCVRVRRDDLKQFIAKNTVRNPNG